MIHARASVKRYGGIPEDYIKIHDFFDSTKAAYPDTKHRAILHNSFGCYIAELVFGHVILNSDGKEVHVRNIAEDHIMEDCGFIPTIEQWLKDLPAQDWMRGAGMKRRIEVLEIDAD
jgi:hypothetical protein